MRGIDAGRDDGNRLCYTVAGKQLLCFMRRRDDCHCRIAEGAAEFACHVFGNDMSAADIMHIILIHGVIGMHHGDALRCGNQLSQKAQGEFCLCMHDVQIQFFDFFQNMRRENISCTIIPYEINGDTGQTKDILILGLSFTARVGRGENIHRVSLFA